MTKPGRSNRAAPNREPPNREPPNREPKRCRTCGRQIEWRKKWERDWDSVRYCSQACRRRPPGEVDRRLEEAILELLGRRPRGATICPSEAARAVFGDDFRAEIERTRQAARRLQAANKLDITQKGVVVDPSTARGPIRLRLR
jgi:hypothetical protein